MIASLAFYGTPFVAQFLLMAGVFEGIVSVDHVFFQKIVDILMLQVAAYIWIFLQRPLIRGGDFIQYLLALPLSRLLRLRVDLSMLIIANSLMLIPAMIALAHVVSLPDRWYQCSALLALFGTTLVVQSGALELRIAAMLGIGLADIFLAGSLVLPAGFLRWLLLLSGIAGAIAGCFLDVAGGHRLRFPFRLDTSVRALDLWDFLGRTSPSLLIQAKALMVGRSVTTLRLGLAIALSLGEVRLIEIFKFDGRSVPVTILVMATISLVVGGFYRTLRDAHESASFYLSSLPITRHYWAIRDTIFVMFFVSMPVFVVLIPLFSHRLLPYSSVFLLVLTYALLLIFLRFPLARGGGGTTLYGFLLASVWSGVAIVSVS